MTITKETPKRYRVRFDADVPGYGKKRGDTGLVSKNVIVLSPPSHSDFFCAVKDLPPEEIQRECESLLTLLRAVYAPSTVRTKVTSYRNYFQSQGTDPEHPLLKYLLATNESFALNKHYARKSKQLQRDQIPFDHEAFIGISVQLVRNYLEDRSHSRNYLPLALGLAGLTGRRFNIEVLFAGRLEIIDSRHMTFSGQGKSGTRAKIQGKIFQRPPYEIPVLADSELVLEGWRALRLHYGPANYYQEIIPQWLRDLTFGQHKISCGRHHDIYAGHKQDIRHIAQKIKTTVSKNAANFVKRHYNCVFRDTTAHPYPDVQTKDLRDMYAETCYNIFAIEASGENRNTYITEILGHAPHGKGHVSERYQKFNLTIPGSCGSDPRRTAWASPTDRLVEIVADFMAANEAATDWFCRIEITSGAIQAYILRNGLPSIKPVKIREYLNKNTGRITIHHRKMKIEPGHNRVAGLERKKRRVRCDFITNSAFFK
ncbi:MAG: hypothetical protein GY765_20180 [bacterium]|nr:hypothetical protein [bacterium]